MEDGVCCCFRSKDDSVLRCRSLVLLAIQTFSAVVRFLLFSLIQTRQLLLLRNDMFPTGTDEMHVYEMDVWLRE